MKTYNFHPVLLQRIPAMAYNHFKKDDLAFYLDNIYFRNSLFLAAPAFYEVLSKAGFRQSALKPKALKTLYNYINRLHYRSTPFGLFSGFSAICWQGKDEATEAITLKSRKLHLWPELELCETGSPMSFLKENDFLFTNPSLYHSGGAFRFIKKEPDESLRNFDYSIAVMPYHWLVEKILLCFKLPAKIQAVFKVLEKDTNISEANLRCFTEHLIEQQLLLHVKDQEPLQASVLLL